MNLMTGLIHPDHGSITHARHLAARSRTPDADHRLRHAVRRRAALGDRLQLRLDRPAAVRLQPRGGRGAGLEGARAPRASPKRRTARWPPTPRACGSASAWRRPSRTIPRCWCSTNRSTGSIRWCAPKPSRCSASGPREGRHVILSSHVLQEVDVISDQVILIANGMIVAEGEIRNVREEIHEHPSQFIIRCRDASRVASLLFQRRPRHRDQPERRPPGAARDDPEPRAVFARARPHRARRPPDRQRHPRRRERGCAVRVPHGS